jgi:SAM-dependent methyltransferase|tara:strand:+ start:79 stop:864 length:786 start_codon:yes stop_codon:yes gene_type:complete
MATDANGSSHWFELLAEHMGTAYLRYAFTKGTSREVDRLFEVFDLSAGDRVLDVGCGPGRHALELARRGVQVVGIDISERFVNIAAAAASAERLDGLVSFQVGDARELSFEGEFDFAISMCEGAFGLQCGPAATTKANLEGDRKILASMAHSLIEGGKAGVAAFSSYFQVLHLENESGERSDFDAMSATATERTEIRNPKGDVEEVTLWTTCFTPRELWLLAESVGLTPVSVQSAFSGKDYSDQEPDLESPEFFLVAQKLS